MTAAVDLDKLGADVADHQLRLRLQTVQQALAALGAADTGIALYRLEPGIMRAAARMPGARWTAYVKPDDGLGYIRAEYNGLVVSFHGVPADVAVAAEIDQRRPAPRAGKR